MTGDVGGKTDEVHPVAKITILIETGTVKETFTIERAINLEMASTYAEPRYSPLMDDRFFKGTDIEKLTFSFVPLPDEAGSIYKHQIIGPEMIEQYTEILDG